MLPDALKNTHEEVCRLLHSDCRREATEVVADWAKIKLGNDRENQKAQNELLSGFLHHLLNNQAMPEAAAMLWTPAQFTAEPASVRAIWKLFEEANFGIILSGASCGKSYSLAVRLFLEYLRDPEYTSVRVVGPSEAHLEANLFSHLVSLHQSATLPMPGDVGERFVGLDRRNLLGSIQGVVIPIGSRKKSGRLQGGKRKPRPVAHPVFGNLSRLFLFLDEAENIPSGIWSDITNVMSNLDEAGSQGLKIFAAYNPMDLSLEVARQAEPEFGWANLDPDTHFRWKSARGWDVLRIDAEKCENVVQDKIIFPGFQSRAGVEQIAKKSGGRNTPGYFSMVRGAYSPQGIELVIIPSGMWAKMRGEFIWLDKPINIAGCDLALEGGAASVFTLGKFGLATGVKYPPSIEFPTGRTAMFKNNSGQIIPRYGAQADQQFSLPKGGTVQMKDEIVALCRKAGVRGEHIALDRTGHTAGVCDLLKHEWSSAIIDVNYSEGGSDMKIMQEDKHIAKEEYPRVDSELWFALKYWGEFSYFLVNPALDISELTPQITGRRYKTLSGKNKVESKRDYTSRMPGSSSQASPDHADSLCLFVHAARKHSRFVPSMTGNTESTANAGEDWPFSGGVRIDVSNRMDTLEGNDNWARDGIL